MNTLTPSAELLELARLVKRTLQHQQRFYRSKTPELMRECKDLERRLLELADSVIMRGFETPNLPFPEGGADEARATA